MPLLDDLRQQNPKLASYSDDQLKRALRQQPQFKYLDDPEFDAYVSGHPAQSEQQGEPGFGAGLSAGLDQMQAMGGGLVMAAGEKLGSEGLWDAGREIYTRNMEEAGENALEYGFTDLFSDPDTSALQWAKYTAGNLLPMLATSVAGGGAGGIGARLLAGNVAKQAATRAGQAIGASAASTGMETGAIMGEVENADVALAHGSVAGALDALPIMRALRKFGGDELADKAAGEIATRTLDELRRTAGRGTAAAAGRGSLTQMLAEASTEGLQGLIGQHANYWVENNGETLLNNLGEVDVKAMIDEAAAGGLMGGLLGAPAGVAERGQARKADTILRARQQAAEQGGDSLDQAQAAQQAEQVTPDDIPQADPAVASDLGNRLQMAMGGMDELQSLARGSSFEGATRLRNVTRLLDNAEQAFEAGEYDRAERLLQRADGIASDLRGALAREGSNERPAQREGELVDDQPVAGYLGNDSRRLPPGDPSTIYAEGPAADRTQYDPRARNVRRDEGMAAQREGADRLRETVAGQRPQLADSGTIYGQGPVAGNANTGMEQQTAPPTQSSDAERMAEWERLWREQGMTEPGADLPDTTIDITGRAEPEVVHTMPDGSTMAGPEHEGAVPGTTRAAEAVDEAPAPEPGGDPGQAVRVPTERINVDPEAYQFRSEVDEAGTDDRLTGTREWDDLRAGNVLIHKREDGSLYVADGHHRVRLAQELGQPVINAQIVREADGVSVADARRMAAESNIANDSATPLDAAKVFRDSDGGIDEIIAEANLPPKSALVRDGIAISRLGDEAFGAVVNGQVDEKSAAVIGRTFSDPAEQLAAVGVFQRVSPTNDTQRTILTNEIRNAGFDQSQGEQGGLFGDDPTESLIGERVRILDRLRGDLVRDKRLFATLNRHAPRAEAAGNQIATEANQQQSDRSAKAVDLLGRAATDPDLNQAVNDAARRVRDGEAIATVVDELKTRLIDGRQAQAAQAPAGAQRATDGQPAVRRGQEPGRGEQGAARDPAGREGEAEPRRSDQGLTLKADGTPFATEASAMASGAARRAKAQGQTVDAVPVDGGLGVRVGEPADDAPLLETQTEESLAARERETQQAEQAETRRRQEEAQRAQADAEADDFTLAGSDLPADQAAARGQDPLFSFVGQRAETADPHELERAESMLSQGHDGETVRRETGWFVGADGKWRFEIDDSDARFLPFVDKSAGELWTKSLDEVLDHPGLFAAYPALREMDVVSARGVEASGMYLSGSREIILNADMGAMEQFSTLLHEIQHGIQNIEGFARGGSPRTVATRVRRQIIDRASQRGDHGLVAEYRRLLEDYSLANQAKRIVDLRTLSQPRKLFSASEWYEYRDQIIDVHGDPPKRGEARRQYASQAAAWIANRLERESPIEVKRILNDHGLDWRTDPRARDQDARRQLNNLVRRAERHFQRLDRDQLRQAWADQEEAARLGDVSPDEARDLYQRLAGEVEARNVQARQGMAEDERAETPPTATQDVPDSDVIVVFNGQDMASAPEPANAPDGAEAAAPTVTMADDIATALDGIEELGDVQVVQSASDLPSGVRDSMARQSINGRDVRGVYVGDELYVVADNVGSVQEGIEVAVHEAVGHKGMRGVLGADLDRVMLGLYRSLPNSEAGRKALDEVREAYPFLDPAKRADRITIGEEMVAHLLEKGHRPKAWQRAVTKVRELLRRAFPMVAWTYTDVLALGEQSREFLRRQLAEQGGKADPMFSLRSKQRAAFEQAFDDFTDADRAAAAKIGARTPPQRAMDWFKEKADRAGLKIRQGMVDRVAALKEIDEKLYGESALGENINRSSWVLARMSNAANGALHAMLHNGRIRLDAKEKVITLQDGDAKGLGEVLGRLGSAAEIERFFGWIAGNRADQLSKDGRENLFDVGDIEAMKGWNRGQMEDGSSREQRYREVFEEFQQYRDDVLAVAEQSGIISSDQREMWAEEFYVPFYRLSEEKGAPTGQMATSGLSRQQAYKRLKGGTQNLNDLLQNSMLNFHHLLDASLKNQAAVQAVENAKQLGMVEKVPEGNRDTKKSTFVMEGGRKVFYEIDDPLVFQALTALAHPGMNSTAMRVMRTFKRVFTNLTTTTPQFMVANLIRDSLQAAATNDVSKNAFKNVIDGAGAYRDQRTRAQMMAAGASFNFGHLFNSNPDELRAQLTRNMRDAKLVDGPYMVPSVLRAGWAWWGDVNNAAENVNRAAIYSQNRDKGELRAAFEARDLIDFSSHGAWPAVRILIDIVPFLNARIQGLDKIYRSGVKPGASVVAEAFGYGKANVTDKQAAARFWTVTGALAAATIALYLHNQDDDEYQKLEDWQKDSYWFFRAGDQAFFIPKPFEVGAIATMAERVTEQFVDDKATGKVFRQRLAHMMTDTFSFSPVPQAMQPALDIYANYDAFTGRPIESMGMDRLSPELRRRASTTGLAQVTSNILNATVGAIGNPDTNPMALSPVQVDHLIGGYLGQVGSWGAASMDVAWNVATGQEDPARRWYEHQPIRRFYKSLGDEDRYTKYGTVFYEGLREAGRAYADVRELREMGRLADAAEAAQTNREMLALRKPLNRAQSRLRTINQRVDIIRRSDLDGEIKRQRIDRLNAIKNQVQRAMGERILEARAN